MVQVTDAMGRRERKLVSTYNESRSFHDMLQGTGLTRGPHAPGSQKKLHLPKQLRITGLGDEWRFFNVPRLKAIQAMEVVRYRGCCWLQQL